MDWPYLVIASSLIFYCSEQQKWVTSSKLWQELGFHVHQDKWFHIWAKHLKLETSPENGIQVSETEINYLCGCREFYSQPVSHYLFAASIFHAGLNQCDRERSANANRLPKINLDEILTNGAARVSSLDKIRLKVMQKLPYYYTHFTTKLILQLKVGNY